MDYAIIKQMVEDEIIDFNKLLLQNYKKIGLTEIEAFVLIELHNQRKTGKTVISPSKLVKKLTISEEKLFSILDGLVIKQYLSIHLVKDKDKKETEDFSLDNTIFKLIEVYKTGIKNSIIHSDNLYETIEEEIVDILEKQFQRQLKPLEIELIQKWINEDNYSVEIIKRAILDAIKANKTSLSYVDGVLLKRNKSRASAKKVYKPEKSEALKAFFESWEK